MSRTNKKVSSGWNLLVIIFPMCLFCMGWSQGNAQTLQAKANPESYNWKPASDVTALLLNQVTLLNQQLPGLTVGTPIYDNTLRRIAYFKSIVVEIGKGATVAQSLDLALPAAATLGFEKEASYTPTITLRALQTETRIMLTN